MENFPTNQRALLPHAANLLTLVVLVGTGLWSNGQRPALPTLVVAAGSAPMAVKHNSSKVAAGGHEPVQQSPAKVIALLPVDGIVSVGYSGAGLR